MGFRPPRDVRDVLQMFSLYDKAKGIQHVLRQFNLDKARFDALRTAVLGEGSAEFPAEDGATGSAYMEALLKSGAFREAILSSVLHSYPDKRRLIFVHIPKCAGSDLENVLSKRYRAINGDLQRAAFSIDVVFNQLRDLVLAAPFVDTFFIRGHVPLPTYVDQKLIRPSDEIFTVIRDPYSLVISHVNYRLTRLLADPTGKRVDAAQWLNRLGLKELPEGLSDDELLALGKKMLHDARMIPATTLCRLLGHGTTESAMEMIAASDIEITDTARYDTWLQDRWKVPRSPHTNESRKFLTASTLDARDKQAIADMTAEDRKLFEKVRDALDRSGKSSIRGRELLVPVAA